MADTEEAPRYVWIDVGHISGNLPEGVAPQSGKVAVDPDTGSVLADQPDYPEQPEDPPSTPPEPAPKASKSAS